MKSTILTVLALAGTVVFTAGAETAPAAETVSQPELRKWSALSGDEFEAELIGVKGGSAIMRLADGEEITPALVSFTPGSRKLIEELAAAMPPLPPSPQERANRIAYANQMERYWMMNEINKNFLAKNDALKTSAEARKEKIKKEDPEISLTEARLAAMRKELEIKSAELETVYSADDELGELQRQVADLRKGEEKAMQKMIAEIGAKVRERGSLSNPK